MKNVLFFVFVLLMVHSFASFGESNYAALLTHMIRNNYLIKKYLPCDDGITGYYMDDMQNLNSNIFQYHNNRYTNTIHDVFVNMGSEKLRNIYHNSISNYAIQTIANMTCILSLLYPSSNDIEYLIENIQLDEDRFVPGRYSQKTRWSFVSNNLTNRVIVRALQEYIVQAYKNIKKKDFIIMTSKLMDLWKHSRPEKEITKDLQQCLFICYTILDPTNIKSMAESYEFMREIQASKPQHWLRFYETNTVFVFATYTDTFQLAELLQNDIKIDGCDDRYYLC